MIITYTMCRLNSVNDTEKCPHTEYMCKSSRMMIRKIYNRARYWSGNVIAALWRKNQTQNSHLCICRTYALGRKLWSWLYARNVIYRTRGGRWSTLLHSTARSAERFLRYWTGAKNRQSKKTISAVVAHFPEIPPLVREHLIIIIIYSCSNVPVSLVIPTPWIALPYRNQVNDTYFTLAYLLL
jgi:hypothetical protein